MKQKGGFHSLQKYNLTKHLYKTYYPTQRIKKHQINFIINP